MSSLGPRVLVADGDPAIRLYVHKALKAEGYAVGEAAHGRTLLRAVEETSPDAIVVDLDLPDMDGMALIRAVRERSWLPIVALSSGGGEEVVVAALEQGADDIVHKPFGIRELVARVKNALRRAAQDRGETPRYTVGDLSVDLVHRRVAVQERAVHLSRNEYEVMRRLVAGLGRVLTHDELMKGVWGEDRVQYLRVVIRALRRKIEADPQHPRYILTEARVGYRLFKPGRRASPRAGGGRGGDAVRREDDGRSTSP